MVILRAHYLVISHVGLGRCLRAGDIPSSTSPTESGNASEEHGQQAMASAY